MKGNVYCKKCKDTIVDPEMYNFRSCKCGSTQVQKVLKGYAVSPGADYCMVDDQGNEIIVTDEKATAAPERVGDPVEDALAVSELMLALSHQVDAMENLSSDGRFSPATNQDLLAHLIWLQEVLRLALKRDVGVGRQLVELRDEIRDEIRYLENRILDLEPQ